MEHLRVLMNSFERVGAFRIELELEVLVFEERRKLDIH